MEIKITHLFGSDFDASELSGSIAERGQNAGKETWNNSMAAAEEGALLKTPENIQRVKDYFKEYGAWDDEERAAWTDQETNALLLQYISGSIREGGLEGVDASSEYDDEWKEYEEGASAGRHSGDIYRKGSDIYFSLCH